MKRWHRWKGESVDLEYPSVVVGKPKYLSVEEIEDLLEKCVTPLERVLVYVLFDTAVRISELVNITLSDIDWKQGLLAVTRKGGRRGEVVMQKESIEAIRDWLSARKSDDERVFMDIDHHTARIVVRKVGKRAGLHITPHMFRHSRAVQMLMAGADPFVVQQHLGHLDIRTTLNIYGQFLPEHLRRLIPKPFKKGREGSDAGH
jgi:integrase/recombinase XerD